MPARKRSTELSRTEVCARYMQGAIKAADRPPEEIIMFRKMIKALSVICHVRVLGKVTLVDKKGRRW